MTKEALHYAQLDPQCLEKIQALENELGTYLVALEKETPFAALSDDQLRRLKALEQELGVVLLAYRRDQLSH